MKRKSDDVFSQFAQQAISAKKSRVNRTADQIVYIQHFLQMLDKFSSVCALCFIFGKECDKHYIIACQFLEQELQDMNITKYLQWQNTLRYPPRSKPAICFFCHVPQLDDTVHAEIKRGGASCTHKDVILPVAFGVYYQPELRQAASNNFGLDWETLKVYGNWLTNRSVPGHATNMVAVFMWYAEKIDEQGVFNL